MRTQFYRHAPTYYPAEIVQATSHDNIECIIADWGSNMWKLYFYINPLAYRATISTSMFSIMPTLTIVLMPVDSNLQMYLTDGSYTANINLETDGATGQFEILAIAGF